MISTLIEAIQNQFRVLASHGVNRRRRRVNSVSPEQLESRHLLSAVVSLIEDLNTQPANSNPSYGQFLASTNGVTFFTASTVAQGNELWRTDGTQQGTFRLTDVLPGPLSSSIETMTTVGDQLFFTARDLEGSKHLFRTDGTVDGTGPLADVSLDSFVGEKANIISFQNGVVFSVSQPTRSIWASDGSEDGTKELFTLAPNQDVQEMQDAGDGRFFYTTFNHDSVNGGLDSTWSLWVSDGTTSGTTSLLTLRGGRDLVIHNGVAYVTGNDNAYGKAIWKSDGTTAGTQEIVQLSSQSALDYLHTKTFVGDQLFFTLLSTANNNLSLWSTMGDQASTVELTTLTILEVLQGPQSQVAFDDELYFVKDGQLWKSNGTPQGTAIAAAPQGTMLNGIFARTDSLFLVGTSPDSGREVWISDGTDTGTTLLNDINLGVKSSILNYQFGISLQLQSNVPHVFFAADDGIHGNELWVTDGTASGTRIVSDIAIGTGNTSLGPVVSDSRQLLFLVRPDPNIRTRELWKTDVNNTGLTLLEPSDSIQVFDGDVYYHKLATDGSLVGTSMWNGSNGVSQSFGAPEVATTSPVFHLAGFDLVFARAANDNTAFAPVDLRLLKNGEQNSQIVSSFSSVYPQYFVRNNILYFLANTSAGDSLWRSDGTIDGTFILSRATDVSYDGTQSQFLPIGDKLLVKGSGGMITDGTVTGTYYLRDVLDNVGGLINLDPFNDVYLIAKIGKGNVGVSLYKSDGTRSGTSLLNPDIFTTIAGAVVTTDRAFILGSSAGQTMLLTSDGTQAGLKTVYIFDQAKNVIENFRAIGNKIIFTVVNSDTRLRTIWISDGSSNGTVPLRTNFNQQLIPSGQADFSLYDGGIAFNAATEATGYELFRIDTTVPVTAPTGLTFSYSPWGTEIAWPDVVGAIQYDVWINSLGNPSAPPVKLRVNDPHYLVDSDLPEGAYRVWIRSLPVLGDPSVWSTAKDFTVGPNPALFSTPTATTDTRPTFQWAGPSDVVSYEIWLTNRDTKTRVLYRNGLTSTSFQVDQTLTPARYAVWVRGNRSDGTITNLSAVNEFNVVRPAIEFTGGVGVQRTSRPTFTWPLVTGATGYNLQVVLAGTSTTVYEANNQKGLWHVPSMDLAGGNYTIRVQAFKGTNPLSASGAGQSLRILIPPANLRSTETGFAWDAVPTAVSYTYELQNVVTLTVLYSKTQAGTTFTLPAALSPGRYALRVHANFFGGASQRASLPYEIFQPATVSITSSNAATVDGTPTITWGAITGAATYQVVVTRAGNTVPVYDRVGIVGTSHRIDRILIPGTYQIQVRAIFNGGSRTDLSAIQTLVIGPAPVVSYANGILQWNSIKGATHYELWVNYLGTPVKPKIVYQPNVLQTSYPLASSFPKGRYQAWVRAVRSESGETYTGLWSVARNFDIL